MENVPFCAVCFELLIQKVTTLGKGGRMMRTTEQERKGMPLVARKAYENHSARGVASPSEYIFDTGIWGYRAHTDASLGPLTQYPTGVITMTGPKQDDFEEDWPPRD